MDKCQKHDVHVLARRDSASKRLESNRSNDEQRDQTIWEFVSQQKKDVAQVDVNWDEVFSRFKF